jgi:uncharacterized protein (DUF1810 family)
MNDTLQRFIEAQEADYRIALKEIKNGKKQSHWMWYIFPQIEGLGFSETSKFYAIKDTIEAESFLKHPILGQRLIEISNELIKHDNKDANQIFGSPDDVKLKSSMTLFSTLQGANPVFQLVLDKFFDGEKDEKTMQMMKR